MSKNYRSKSAPRRSNSKSRRNRHPAPYDTEGCIALLLAIRKGMGSKRS